MHLYGSLLVNAFISFVNVLSLFNVRVKSVSLNLARFVGEHERKDFCVNRLDFANRTDLCKQIGNMIE